MNNPSPLIPQGATPPRGKSSVCFKVFMVVGVHVVVIGGMLLQGCKDTTTKDQTKQDNNPPAASDTMPVVAAPSNTTPSPTDMPPTLNPNISNAYTGAATSAPQAPPISAPLPPPTASQLAPPPAPGETKEYVIAKGDTLGAIARKNGIALKTLLEANPGVNPKKLHVGQKVQIPGGTAALAAAPAPGAAPGATGEAESAVYVVKSGDMLGKIAKTHGTTVKKIMALNDLKTTSIRAGQKLKIPAPKTAEPSAAPASAGFVPTQPASTPLRVSSMQPPTGSPVASN